MLTPRTPDPHGIFTPAAFMVPSGKRQPKDSVGPPVLSVLEVTMLPTPPNRLAELHRRIEI